jgi:hypothetical protein
VEHNCPSLWLNSKGVDVGDERKKQRRGRAEGVAHQKLCWKWLGEEAFRMKLGINYLHSPQS